MMYYIFATLNNRSIDSPQLMNKIIRQYLHASLKKA